MQKFTYPLSSSPEVFFEKCRQAAARSGGTCEGDATAGQFSGQGVAGYYRVVDNTIEVTVTRKPFIIPWSLVESALRGFFAPGA